MDILQKRIGLEDLENLSESRTVKEDHCSLSGRSHHNHNVIQTLDLFYIHSTPDEAHKDGIYPGFGSVKQNSNNTLLPL